MPAPAFRHLLLCTLTLVPSVAGCRATVDKEPALELELLGTLEDVLEGPVAFETRVAPGTALGVGGPESLLTLAAWRTTSPGPLLVDLSRLEGPALQAQIDALVLLALEPGGPILIDREGHWSARLLGPATPPQVVTFDAKRRIASRSALTVHLGE